MNEFIDMAMKSMGLHRDQAESASGGLLEMIRNQADEDTFQELLAQLPGAAGLLDKAPQKDGGEGGIGGMVGGLMKSAGDALGGDAASAIGAVGFLKQAGLDSEQMGPFVKMFLDFLREKAGAGLVQKLLGQLPALEKVSA